MRSHLILRLHSHPSIVVYTQPHRTHTTANRTKTRNSMQQPPSTVLPSSSLSLHSHTQQYHYTKCFVKKQGMEVRTYTPNEDDDGTYSTTDRMATLIDRYIEYNNIEFRRPRNSTRREINHSDIRRYNITSITMVRTVATTNTSETRRNRIRIL